MKRNASSPNGSLNGSQNGRTPAVLELEPVKDLDTLAPIVDRDSTSVETPSSVSQGQESPTVSDIGQKKNKRPVKWLIAAAGVGAIAAGSVGVHWWQYASSHIETDNATVAGHITAISTRVPGTVQQVLVQDNQSVKQGQVLVQLDPRDYQLKLQQAQADLAAAQQKANTANINISLASKNAQSSSTQSQGDVAKARAAINDAQASVLEAQAGVPRAQAQLAQSQANLNKAQTDLTRFTTLLNQGAIAQRDLDAARQTYQVALAQTEADRQAVQQAQAKVAQAQQAVASAQAGLTTAQAGIQQAEAKGIQTNVSQSDFGTAKAAIAQAQVALKNAQLQLSYTTITAPTSGQVGRKNVEVGQQVQPGTPLMALVTNEYWVTANFKETQLGRMQVGQPVEVKLDAIPGKTFTGRVNSLSPASGAEFALLPPDNATGNFTKIVQRIPVKISFDPQSIQGYEGRITPGMSANVSVAVK